MYERLHEEADIPEEAKTLLKQGTARLSSLCFSFMALADQCGSCFSHIQIAVLLRPPPFAPAVVSELAGFPDDTVSELAELVQRLTVSGQSTPQQE